MVFKCEEKGKKWETFLLILLISSMFCTSFAFNTKLLPKNPTRDPVKLAKAMVDVIREFYIANDIKFDFIIYGTATNHINDVISEVTKKLTNEIPINIKHIESKNWDHVLYQSAIIFTESKENIKNLHKNSIKADKNGLSLGNVFPKQFKFLVYIDKIEDFSNAEDETFPKISYMLPDIRMFEFFIKMDNVSINLTAHVLFSPDMCGKFQLKLLNSYNLKSQKWENELKIFNHFDNFHGCLMTFIVEPAIFWYTDEYLSKEIPILEFAFKNLKLRGLTHEIVEKLTKDVNITGHYSILDRQSKHYWSGSKNFVGFYPIGSYLYSSEIVRSIEYAHFSYPIYAFKIYYLVTQNDFYTNYEKLLMPFDFTTWILLSATISLAFGIILISFGFPKWLQTLIHGAGIKDPAFNTIGVIFGIAQVKLPRESGNRLMLALFLWFCLIFRTCYQSKLFEFMTSDMRKPLPASIEDLKEMNYTIILETSYLSHYERLNNEIIYNRERPNIKKVKFMELLYLYEKSLKGENEEKYAFLIDDTLHSLFNSTFKNSLPIMRNEKLLKMVGYFTNRNMLLQSKFDELLEKLFSTGITKHSLDYGKWLLYRPLDYEVEDSRRILSMTDLEFGFVIWLTSISLPIICFLIEISIGFYRKVKKTIEELEMFAITRIVEIVLEKLIQNYHGRW
ncbi:hypothetical protein PVAND_017065 [Polypedilum vanderplanki]|uniref:Ionotropic receptor n=1 Tax=Polypedilum vanderplanki TaxID=319348 RepID=A0A9J6BI10_POLVA|nr:hypothetical protein PVAND_017065 [Polypedilum vanderplanki]